MLQERTNFGAFQCTVSGQLVVPRSRLKGFVDHVLSIAALRLLSALPGSVTSCKSIGAFKKVLRHVCLNLPLIRCNFVFPVKCLRIACWFRHCIIVYYYFYLELGYKQFLLESTNLFGVKQCAHVLCVPWGRAVKIICCLSLWHIENIGVMRWTDIRVYKFPKYFKIGFHIFPDSYEKRFELHL